MFTILTGPTGSGKTQYAVRKLVLPAWLKGTTIYTNIELNFEKYKRFWLFKPKKVGKIYRFEAIEDIYHVENALIFFDDAGKVFNSKRWKEISLEFADKLQTSRHDLLDFIATAPSAKRIYNEFRALTHQWIYCEKVFMVGGELFNFLSMHRIVPKDIDIMEDVSKDVQAEDMGITRYRFLSSFFTPKYCDTHAKINNSKYKLTWLKNQKETIVLINPKTQPLKEAITLWRSYQSGFTLNKQNRS